MSATVIEFANLALRQSTEDPTQIAADAPPACGGGNSYDGRMGLRISSVFVILIGSTFGKLSSPVSSKTHHRSPLNRADKRNIVAGALFPIIATRHPSLRVPSWAFLFTKYFGSGVIIATAFIHVRNSVHLIVSISARYLVRYYSPGFQQQC